jgi:hypothetical protein
LRFMQMAGQRFTRETFRRFTAAATVTSRALTSVLSSTTRVVLTPTADFHYVRLLGVLAIFAAVFTAFLRRAITSRMSTSVLLFF